MVLIPSATPDETITIEPARGWANRITNRQGREPHRGADSSRGEAGGRGADAGS
jgi:hypothetical protein